MWPAALPQQIRRDRHRRAEVKVYDELAATLTPDWTVFYSRPWLGITATGAEVDGEVDFVVAHPQRGFLTLEVKGGGISYDPAQDRWRSKDANGIRHIIKNPFEQARRAKHSLLQKLKESRGWPRDRFVRARHAVVFPDSEKPTADLGADRPLELICSCRDLPHLREWIESRLCGGEAQELGKDGVRALENLLAKPFVLEVPLGHVLEEADREIALLTPEQFHILDAIAFNPRVAIGGGAGTGKTVVAMEDAVRIAQTGKRTLLTCFSNPLAAMLRQRLKGRAVTVKSFPELCREADRRLGLPERPFTDSSPERLLDAAARVPELSFDAIIVDEGQDFRSHWWVALDGLLASPSASVLHVYYDSNQSLYGSVASELAGFSMLPIHFSRNLRNTKAVHEVASRFYQGLPVRAEGPDGVSVEWLPCAEGKLPAELGSRARKLISAQSVPAREIAILAPRPQSLARIRSELATWQKDVVLATIADFKGLERSVVLLAATRALADDRQAAYVGLSRARTLLIVAGEPAILSWLRGETVPASS